MMALLQVNFNSTTLHRKVPMQVILPTDAGSEGPFNTLYLLHGLMDNCTAWTSNTRIERWAMERNLAGGEPSGPGGSALCATLFPLPDFPGANPELRGAHSQ